MHYKEKFPLKKCSEMAKFPLKKCIFAVGFGSKKCKKYV